MPGIILLITNLCQVFPTCLERVGPDDEWPWLVARLQELYTLRRRKHLRSKQAMQTSEQSLTTAGKTITINSKEKGGVARI